VCFRITRLVLRGSKIAGWRLMRGIKRGQNQVSERARLEYIMAHSFSHSLMSEVAIHCGYPASALKERIYVLPRSPGDAIRLGVLI
jgi:hypothetical protein